MNTVVSVNCNCQFHQEIYVLISQIEHKINTINSGNELPISWRNQQDRITTELAKVGRLLDLYKLQCVDKNSKTNEQFIQGYQMGKQCNQVLYDASQIPIQEVKMALALDLNQNPIPPYLMGIQVGWRLGVVEQSLTRFLPDEKTNIA
ncbi:hypothetical protein PCC9214_00635 [Planktothrix tepida]|uniref:Uncharacterized protein n=2 Tax=Planktothrix TaxID=54304 RepID=A0A1J1LED4_9CYAN|nr:MULTISPECIES: hypothetical protein [Planktothrix]CAD5920623.1 hypothetical protein PCC9214_00635 [Planktothrix tepida]CAD5983238.1 hypothetical protein NO713_05156 [Planktothrix pseudagardhii]CUR30925.1 hypothetical protein PL9214290516 [Planktothrix tepida PCC 9214]